MKPIAGRVFRPFHVKLLLALAFLPAAVLAQNGVSIRVGGGFDSLGPEQQALVRSWHEEYAGITGNQVDPKNGYDNLKLSVRTTFEAVTNALLETKLTDAQGKSLGNALSLVKLVEAVHGEVPQTRGDEQYRVYVRLEDDALKKLYQCREFRRTADNGIYHIGYPINFRQLGGVPSIQISVTRTGLRADIDVDYRSSGGPLALVNGHLTAANSDIRAGKNYWRHTSRWQGLGNWWNGFFGITPAIPKRELAALSSGFRKPPVGDSQPVQAAVKDFYQSWLVDERPELSLSYLSVKANACIAAFPGESERSSLIRLRLLQYMTEGNKKLGGAKSLEEVLQGVAILDAGARPVVQPDGKLFSIVALPDSLARRIDCRLVHGVPLAEGLPPATDRFGDYYSSAALIRGTNSTGPGQLFYMVWHREAGTWKIVSWYLEDPFANNPGPQTEDKGEPETDGPKTTADPGVEAAVQQFLKEWLVARDIDTAMKFVAPEARSCAGVGRGDSTQPALSEHAWFQEVAKDIPKSDTLAGAIERVDASLSQMEEVGDLDPDAYLLVKISDDMAAMYSCAARAAGKKPGPADDMGKPYYNAKAYQAIFQPRHKTGDRGTVVLTWERRKDRWMIVAFDIVTY